MTENSEKKLIILLCININVVETGLFFKRLRKMPYECRDPYSGAQSRAMKSWCIATEWKFSVVRSNQNNAFMRIDDIAQLNRRVRLEI